MWRPLLSLENFFHQSFLEESLSGVAVDLGSAQTRIAIQGQVVFQQATCLALHRKTNEVIAIGQAAAELVGKTPPQIQVVFPVRRGKVQDIVAAQLFLQLCLKKVLNKTASPQLKLSQVLRPAITLAIPLATSSAEQDMLRKLFREIGFSRVHFVLQLQAAYHFLELQKKVGRIFVLVNIGAMRTEMAFFAQNEMVVHRVLAIGGDDFTQAVLHQLQKQYHCQVGWQTAEKVKIHLGLDLEQHLTADAKHINKKMIVRGRDILSSLPTTIQVSAEELIPVYQPLLSDLIQNMADLFQDAAPEVMAEGLDQGVMLIGGGSLLSGISTVFERGLRSPIHISRTALEDVVRGI